MRTFLRLALCCVVTSLAGQVDAQLAGSLFTQPEEREYLDYLRLEFLRTNAEEGFDIEESDIPEIPTEVAVTEETGPELHSFGGAMTRRDGSYGIWLDGILLDEQQLPEGFSVVQDNRVISLRITRADQTYLLRTGQTVDLTAGTVTETARTVAPAPLGAPAASQDLPSAAEIPVTATDAAASVAGSPAPQTAVSGAASADAANPAEVSTQAAEADPASILGDNVDGAVARLTEAEAAALEAALERRRAATAQSPAGIPADLEQRE